MIYPPKDDYVLFGHALKNDVNNISCWLITSLIVEFDLDNYPTINGRDLSTVSNKVDFDEFENLFKLMYPDRYFAHQCVMYDWYFEMAPDFILSEVHDLKKIELL